MKIVWGFLSPTDRGFKLAAPGAVPVYPTASIPLLKLTVTNSKQLAELQFPFSTTHPWLTRAQAESEALLVAPVGFLRLGRPLPIFGAAHYSFLPPKVVSSLLSSKKGKTRLGKAERKLVQLPLKSSAVTHSVHDTLQSTLLFCYCIEGDGRGEMRNGLELLLCARSRHDRNKSWLDSKRDDCSQFHWQQISLPHSLRRLCSTLPPHFCSVDDQQHTPTQTIRSRRRSDAIQLLRFISTWLLHSAPAPTNDDRRRPRTMPKWRDETSPSFYPFNVFLSSFLFYFTAYCVQRVCRVLVVVVKEIFVSH